jgi:thiamine biosynthesis lipoprotein
MGSICEARAFGDEVQAGAALDLALDRIAALEDAMTTWRIDGELAVWNAACSKGAKTMPVSPDLLAALSGARRWAERTEGLFDPAIGPLVAAWGLQTGGRVPTDEEIENARALSSWRQFEIDRTKGTVHCLARGVALDLGGYGKGFALDEAARVLREHGIDSALFNFGGQVLVLDAPPGEPGWIVEIAHPEDRLLPVAELVVARASVSTSSNTERGHVLDPRTGRPATWRAAVTVVTRSAADADALSTALLVAGREGARSVLPSKAEFVALEGEGERVRVVQGTRSLLERLSWKEGARSTAPGN